MRKCSAITAPSITILLTAVFLLGALPAYAQEDLSDFGPAFQVFQQSRDAFRRFDLAAENVVISLPPTYQLGPGDVLNVILTGMINDSLPIQVGPQGNVYVPPAGLLEIEGMTVAEARDYIKEELDQFLINYECQLQLVNARKIQVYLLGQVRQPGTYIALSGTTTTSLIQTAGSVVVAPVTINFDETAVTHPYFRALTAGAGRRAEIWRDGEKIGQIDLADVAIMGRTQGDIVLEDGDAVFVPPNHRPVLIRGGVSRPGTYEALYNDTVLNLLAQAGYFKNLIIPGPVYVERRNPGGGERDVTIHTLEMTDPDFNPREFLFEAGDILRVPETRNQVYVLGAVWMPQAVDYHEGWTALDYIAASGGPVAPTDISWIQVVSNPLTEQQSSLTFDLKGLTLDEETENVEINPGDLIWVPWDNQPFYGPGLTTSITTILGQTLGLLRIIEEI